MKNYNKIDIGNFSINYVYVNDIEKSPLVLFMHGFSDSISTFKTFFNKKSRNYNYAAFDFPGCGESSSADDIKLEDYAEVAQKFVEMVLKNEKKIIIVSHSLGAFGALSALVNKNVKEAILLSPFNYNLNREDAEKKANIDRWLLPHSREDAEDAYLSFFATITPSIVNTSKIYSRHIMAEIKQKRNKFGFMLKEEILNSDFLNNKLKPLYVKNRNYSIIVGCQDKFTSLNETNEIADDLNIEYVTVWNAGHAIISEAGDFVKNFVQKRAQRYIEE